MSEPSWELYRAFLAVAAEGSLSGAARSLGLSQPTLGRQIAALEAALDVALFTRSPGGLILTDAGSNLRPQAEAMAAAAAALVRAAAPNDAEAGVVRVSCSEVIGGAVIPPILADLRDAYPRVRIELVVSNRNDDLLRRDADIAVRMARPTQSALYGRRIGEMEVALFASPSYVQRHGRPLSFDDREHHTFIGFDHVPSYAGKVISNLEITRELFDVRTDNDLAQLALIQAGVGIGGCQVGLARRLNLTPVLPGAFSFSMEIWVVTHEDLKSVKRVRIVMNALVGGLEQYLAEQA